jgi:uncharacterized glyoxalase superfamily protein PhnB
MDTQQRLKTQSIYPALRYNDARAAIRWLGNALGFEEHEVCPGEGDAIAHAELKIAGNLVMLGSGDGAQGIYIALESPEAVDACYARAKAAGAQFVRELTDTDYGSHEFTVHDPEGHRWSFGTYRPQASS